MIIRGECRTGGEVPMVWSPCVYARRWPELWEPLTESERWVLSLALADDPPGDASRSEIADLADYVAGTITADEYEQRAEWRMVGEDSIQVHHGMVDTVPIDTAA